MIHIIWLCWMIFQIHLTLKTQPKKFNFKKQMHWHSVWSDLCVFWTISLYSHVSQRRVGAEGRTEPGTTTAAGWWDLAKAPCFRSHLPALRSGVCSIRAEWTRPQGQRGHNLSEAAVPTHWAIWRYWWLKVTFISSTRRVVIDPALACRKHPHHFTIVRNQRKWYGPEVGTAETSTKDNTRVRQTVSAVNPAEKSNDEFYVGPFKKNTCDWRLAMFDFSGTKVNV